VWITVGDACYAGGFGRTRAYELIGDGTLHTIKLGRKRLVSMESLERLGSAR
jgi:hypothetical protein